MKVGADVLGEADGVVGVDGLFRPIVLVVVLAGCGASGVYDILEIDGAALAVSDFVSDGDDEVVGPGIISVALVHGVMFVDVLKALAVGRWAGALSDVCGGYCVYVVTDGWQQGMENALENVQVHGIARHVPHFRVVGWPPPEFGVDALRSHGFMWAHASASFDEPQPVFAGGCEAWECGLALGVVENELGAGAVVFFSVEGAFADIDVNDPFVVEVVRVIYAVEFASDVPGGSTLLAVLAAWQLAWLISIFWWVEGSFERRGLELRRHSERLVVTFASDKVDSVA